MPRNGSEAALGVLATAAVVVVILSVQQAGRSADAGRQGAADVAEQSAQQVRQDRQVYADKVYLGEPPRDDPGSAGGRVVVNASGLRMEDVWVADDSGRAISIRSAERCTMYALPADFEAEHLYFTDPNGRWHLPFGGQVEQVPLHAYPAPGSDSADPAWSAVLADCTG